MNLHGAQTSKLKLVYYSKNQRGVHAAVNISRSEEILFVPFEIIVKQKDIKATDIAKKLISKGIWKGDYLVQLCLAIYLLLERRKPVKDQKYGPYFEVFPDSTTEFPFRFGELEFA